jgi:hypothetical protein
MAVSPTRRPPFTPRKIPGTQFCYRLNRSQDHSEPGKVRSIEKFDDLIGIGTGDLPACSVVPQPTTLPRDPGTTVHKEIILILFNDSFSTTEVI